MGHLLLVALVKFSKLSAVCLLVCYFIANKQIYNYKHIFIGENHGIGKHPSDILKLMMDKAGDAILNYKNNVTLQTYMHWAAEEGQAGLLKLLLDTGWDCAIK